jgi:hypothetical protein
MKTRFAWFSAAVLAAAYAVGAGAQSAAPPSQAETRQGGSQLPRDQPGERRGDRQEVGGQSEALLCRHHDGNDEGAQGR